MNENHDIPAAGDPDDALEPTVSADPIPRPGLPRWVVVFVAIAVLLGVSVIVLDRIHIGSKVTTAPGAVLAIEPVLEVEGTTFFPSDGEINLTTVRSNLDPTALELIAAWLDDAVRVQEREQVLGDQTAEESRTLGRQQMTQSLEIAQRVALEHLGYDVITEAGALVVQVAEDAPVGDAVAVGDVVVRAADEPVTTSVELVEIVQSLRPGDELEFVVLEADGTERIERVVLGERDGTAFLGVAISTFVDMGELPIEIELDTRRIGGPSAGLALTLSVLDVLTEGELTGGLQVATTGTIDPLGNVGPIGGIEQKTHAVIRAGMDLFIIPANDVERAREVAGDRVDVVGVATLDEALEALAERGGNALDLALPAGAPPTS